MFKNGTEYWQRFNKIQRNIIEITILINTILWSLLAISIYIMPQRDTSQITVATIIVTIILINLFLVNRLFDKKSKNDVLTKEEHFLLVANMFASCPLYGFFVLFGLLSSPTKANESMFWDRTIGLMALILIIFDVIFISKIMENEKE